VIRLLTELWPNLFRGLKTDYSKKEV